VTFPGDRNEVQEHTAEEKRKLLAIARGEAPRPDEAKVLEELRQKRRTEGTPGGFKSFADALPPALREKLEEIRAEGYREDELCPRCKGYTHPGHSCCACLDGGRVTLGDGLIALCDVCSGGKPREHYSIEDWAATARVPLKFQDATIETWKIPVYREKGGSRSDPKGSLKAWLASWPPERPFLSFLGPPGLGKTHLAVGVARAAALSHDVRVRMYRADEILERYRASFDKETAVEREDKIDAELRAIPLLVLDDLTTASTTDWATKKILALVNFRYQEMMKTIVTANEADLDERTHRRLLDESECVVVRLGSEPNS
jgi:DNA replication protein DnaC